MPSYSLGQLAAILGAEIYGDAAKVIKGVASLSTASSSDMAYFDNPQRERLLRDTQAAAVLLNASQQPLCPVDALVVPHPFLAMAETVKLFEDTAVAPATIHPNAIVDLSAELGHNVSIGANTVIGEGVVLGDGVRIGANCVLEKKVRIGSQTRLHNAVMLHEGTVVGAQVGIDSGAVIGALPFNVIKRLGAWHSGPAIGGVLIADYCRIGANTVIDRGSVSDTLLEQGVFLDNLVQIAHDVSIGHGSAIAGCAAVGAHTHLGAHCIIGGASTIAANLCLTDEVVITGMSTVAKSLLRSGVYSSGTLVCEHKRWRKNAARFKQLDYFIQRLQRMEKEIL
ncbi:MAG: UDP-3-O-(3-hydroxymyristoyl)glucosamine N-acyltransferase [Legionellaceae bacterium]|nr:UDP-3-O-(3-hydroxymyristoyl)glucosamine N-acyltransferase [Legionellaceae bacterium]